jgi:hypothetical protein
MHVRSWPYPLAALALAACADAPTAAPALPAALEARGAALRRDRLATIEIEGRFPALYFQNADGSGRFRVHFAHVRDRIAGNHPAELLPVRDETIMALGPAKWSPDGRQLAIVVTLGFDQSQVVVMNADGHNMRTASPNGQIILGDVDWSPDSRRIAYTMSTEPNAGHVDLFATDLVKDEVRRLTTKGLFSVWDEYRWDASGSGLHFTEFEGWTADGTSRLSRVNHVTLAGELTGSALQIAGDPQGLARDGSWALVTRWPKEGDGSVRELARVRVGGGEETALDVGSLLYAELLEGDEEAVLVSDDRDTGARLYRVLGARSPADVRATLAVPGNASSMALLRGVAR